MKLVRLNGELRVLGRNEAVRLLLAKTKKLPPAEKQNGSLPTERILCRHPL